MSKIYTKTGDNSVTSLLGKRVKKDCLEIGTLGDIDELNASLGVLNAQINVGDFKKIMGQIVDIQNNLFIIGSNVAAVGEEIKNIPKLNEQSLIDLEDWIDAMEKDLPPLHNFILPGGSSAATQSFLARAVCRRAERNFVSLSEKYNKIDPLMKKYLNRLSDYLFVLARFLNKKNGLEEILWGNKY